MVSAGSMIGNDSDHVLNDNITDGANESGEVPHKSLCIPIRSSATSNPDQFIEIFPEEVSEISTSTLISLLKDEDAPLTKWTEAALHYMTHQKERESTTMLSTACSDLVEVQNKGTKEERLRVLAAAGIGYLTQATKQQSLNGSSSVPGAGSSNNGVITGDGMAGSKSSSHTSGGNSKESSSNEELRSTADALFTRASKIDQFSPMTWIGRGMLNLSTNRLDQARFFFDTTLKQKGNILPALLGMACVEFHAKEYENAMKFYGQSIKLFPERSGSGARVGLGLCAYKLGQIDRAKAAFRRAYQLANGENVEAMVGMAILNMASLDDVLSKDYGKKMENAVKLISMANLLDSSNAMVQNHLANYYFKRWTPVPGVTVKVEQGSCVVKSNVSVTMLDVGEKIRIGSEFETSVVHEDYQEDDNMMEEDDEKSFRIKDPWKGVSTESLKLWKKDYERVLTLANGAYSSTSVKEIQAESLLLLGRVHHVRDDMEAARNYYEQAIKLAPALNPARFGLAQTLIWEEAYDEAAKQLKEVLKVCPNATDAHAALGLLEVKSGKDRRGAFAYLKKAIDLEPLDPDLVLLEALALQQKESDYSISLQHYTKAVNFMEAQKKPVSWEILTNMGVLCHETKKYEEAAVNYEKALRSLDIEHDDGMNESSLMDEEDYIRHDANRMFWNYVDSGLTTSVDKSDTDGLTWKVTGLSDQVKTGDHVRIGDGIFHSEIVVVGTDQIMLKQKYISPSSEEGAEDKDSTELFVKRSNKRLAHIEAVSVTFNFARLHEAAGRTVAAVELHKAILKRHPSYFNSYLRLACIARDCGSLLDCSKWLQSAIQVEPEHPEVLCLVGNLHLSLCDWSPAQKVFDELLRKKRPDVEAYSMLCIGNIYFSNVKTSKQYTKHLKYSADWYNRILKRDPANAYAANGLGSVLAERADLLKAKEIFNRVREISGDSIPDALLNLGHIYLALRKHPEAIQMYQSYMNRTRNNGAPITSKSQDDDDAKVLLYLAFAYFDWARETESYNNIKAEPADVRYKKCIEYIELAIMKNKKDVVLKYNLCMAKLQAANCVLQKLTRGIRRTAKEVQGALDGLEASLPKVEEMVRDKQQQKKVPIGTTILNNFVKNCKENIKSAKSHLSQELKREAEAKEVRDMQRIQAKEKQREIEEKERQNKERMMKAQQEMDRKAMSKQMKVNALLAGWQHKEKEEPKAKAKTGKPVAEEDVQLFDDGDSDDDVADNEVDKKDPQENGDDNEGSSEVKTPTETENDLFGNDSDDDHDDGNNAADSGTVPSQKDLFGGDSSDSDEDLIAASKRGRNNEDTPKDTESEAPAKKRRVVDEDEDE